MSTTLKCFNNCKLHMTSYILQRYLRFRHAELVCRFIFDVKSWKVKVDDIVTEW